MSWEYGLRDIIEPHDLPVTQGLQKNIARFTKLDEPLDLSPVLDHLVARPRLDLRLSADTEARLPEIAGRLSVALGRAFRIMDPKVKNPQSERWELHPPVQRAIVGDRSRRSRHEACQHDGAISQGSRPPAAHIAD